MSNKPMDIGPTIAVYIPDSEAKKFLLFKQYFDVFEAMDGERVFDMQFGKAILNFKAGFLETIEKHEVVYKRPLSTQ